MSLNANILIEKMNLEQIKQQKSLGNTPEKLRAAENISQRNKVTINTDDREAQNQEKAVRNLLKERKRLIKRTLELSQPDYLLNLRRDLLTTEEEIKEQERIKKRLVGEQAKNEKQLSNVLDANDTDVTALINDTTHRLTSFAENVERLRFENERALEFRDKQNQKLEVLKQRVYKLNQIANHYGVSLEQSKLESGETKQLQEQVENLQKQQRILVQAIDTQQKRNEAVLSEKRRELSELNEQSSQLVHEFNVKHQKLTYNAIEIRDLIEKAKESADETLLEILFKWQHANDQVIRQKEQDFSDYNSIISLQNDAKLQKEQQRGIRAQMQPHEIQQFKDQRAYQEQMLYQQKAEIEQKAQQSKRTPQKQHLEARKFKEINELSQHQIITQKQQMFEQERERIEKERNQATQELRAQLDQIMAESKRQEEALKQQIAKEREERIREQQRQAELLRQLEKDKEKLIRQQQEEMARREREEKERFTQQAKLQQATQVNQAAESKASVQVAENFVQNVDVGMVNQNVSSAATVITKSAEPSPQTEQSQKAPLTFLEKQKLKQQTQQQQNPSQSEAAPQIQPSKEQQVVQPLIELIKPKDTPVNQSPKQDVQQPLSFMERQRLKQQQQAIPEPIAPTAEIPVLDFAVKPRRAAGAPPTFQPSTPRQPDTQPQPQNQIATTAAIEEVPLLDIGRRPRRVAGNLNSPKNPSNQIQEKVEVQPSNQLESQNQQPLQTEGLQKASLWSTQDETIKDISEVPLAINQPKTQQRAPQIRVANVPKTISVKPPLPNLDELEDY